LAVSERYGSRELELKKYAVEIAVETDLIKTWTSSSLLCLQEN
jgi:hypothetical protein